MTVMAKKPVAFFVYPFFRMCGPLQNELKLLYPKEYVVKATILCEVYRFMKFCWLNDVSTRSEFFCGRIFGKWETQMKKVRIITLLH